MCNPFKGGKMLFQKRIVLAFIALFFSICLFSGYQNAFANGIHPVVETQWLADNLGKPGIQVVFMDNWPSNKEDFDSKHVPGSLFLGVGQLMGAVGNGSTPPDKAKFEAFMGELGINKDDHVIIHGLNSDNPFTLGAAWLMEYFGHNKISYLNGSLTKWIKENRATAKEMPAVKPLTYKAESPNEAIRADAAYVLKGLKNPKVAIVDARGTEEYTGKNNKEENKRVGHIPGAVDLGAYETNFKEDGTLKSADELKAIYEAKGITKDKEVITYCQGGIKAGNSYFVLKHVLGYPDVKDYVGSWGEWGNRVDFEKYPIEK